jgi:hypothetical protein
MMVDALKGAALILAFLGVIAICATWRLDVASASRTD